LDWIDDLGVEILGGAADVVVVDDEDREEQVEADITVVRLSWLTRRRRGVLIGLGVVVVVMLDRQEGFAVVKTGSGRGRGAVGLLTLLLRKDNIAFFRPLGDNRENMQEDVSSTGMTSFVALLIIALAFIVVIAISVWWSSVFLPLNRCQHQKETLLSRT
jgi:hypothetical protein